MFDGTEDYEVTKTIELGDLDELGPVSSDEETGGAAHEMEIEELVPKCKELTPCSFQFNQHKGSVFSVGLEPAGVLAVSGGEDDRGLVWKLSDGEVVMECAGHKDSVVSCGFSYDGKYVHTADMSGRIQVLRVKSGEMVFEFETGDIEWTRWHPVAHVLLAGCTDGMTWLWRIPSGQFKTFPGHGCANTASAISAASGKLCTGYQDGVVRMWDMKEGQLLHQIKKERGGHSEGVTSLAIYETAGLAVSGSEDGTCKMYKISSGTVVDTIDMCPVGGANSGVESVALSPLNDLLACGTLSGCVGVWDIRVQKMRHMLSASAGIVSLEWCFPEQHNIISCSLDGSVTLWDSRAGSAVRNWNAHSDQVLAMCALNDRGIFATGSADQTAKIFSIL